MPFGCLAARLESTRLWHRTEKTIDHHPIAPDFTQRHAARRVSPAVAPNEVDRLIAGTAEPPFEEPAGRIPPAIGEPGPTAGTADQQFSGMSLIKALFDSTADHIHVKISRVDTSS